MPPFASFADRCINAPTPAPSAGEITPPWAPIVRLPALNHALIIMGWYVEMHEVYSSVCSFRGKDEDQGVARRRQLAAGHRSGRRFRRRHYTPKLDCRTSSADRRH